MKVYVVKNYWEPKLDYWSDPSLSCTDIDTIFLNIEDARTYIKEIADNYEETPKADFVYHFEPNEDDVYGPMDPGMYQQRTMCIETYTVVGG